MDRDKTDRQMDMLYPIQKVIASRLTLESFHSLQQNPQELDKPLTKMVIYFTAIIVNIRKGIFF